MPRGMRRAVARIKRIIIIIISSSSSSSSSSSTCGGVSNSRKSKVRPVTGCEGPEGK